MSKIFSYNKKTTGEGWVSLNSQYNADEIDMIADPNGGLSQKPRTAIPSPFAQMDLVKNAFKRLSMHRSLQREAMDEKLVANALDVAQLFFNYSELKNRLQLVEWNRDVELEKLKSQPEHKLLGETIEMFLEQDKEAFNFDRMDRVYFLLYGNKVVGSTSPVSVFMASPNAEQGKITILRSSAYRELKMRRTFMRQFRWLWNRKFGKFIFSVDSEDQEWTIAMRLYKAWLI